MIAASLFAIACVVATFVMAGSADRRWRRFERLPRHFGFDSKATALWPRRRALNFAPITFAAITLIAIVLSLVLPGQTSGDPATALYWMGLAWVAAMALILFLMARWVRENG